MVSRTLGVWCLIYIICLYGCGYKPMAYFANKALGDKVYVQLKVNLENPEESVKIKDAVNEAIIARFHSRVVSENEADGVLEVNVQQIKDTAIATNAQGFTTFYRVYVNIKYTLEHNGKTSSFSNQGYYDYAASLNSPSTTYNNRSIAIVEAAKQSIDKFVSQVGYSASF
ncbi:hypothetical protein CQA53_09245 [Helicobacter didelphidarum]|uniref:Lipoprotein n=2 Tax=Helicobacter didelphidarum TaxID=2040648 RepID=A0A3D8IBU0_9HELI|nr:hypothetical protein CQA53_09245 [Helicobacter didelphidarum]